MAAKTLHKSSPKDVIDNVVLENHVVHDVRKLGVFYVALLIFFTILIIYILQPFINTLLLAAVLGFLIYPVYDFLQKKTKFPHVTAVIVCVLFVILLSIPLLMTLQIFTREISTITISLAQNPLSLKALTSSCSDASVVCKYVIDLFDFSFMEQLLKDSSTYLIKMITQRLGNIIYTIPLFMLHLFITIVTIYFVLVDGKPFVEKVKHLLPLQSHHTEHLFTQISKTLHGILYGNIFVGLVQAVLAGIGFVLFGIDSPILGAILTLLASFVPLFGTGLVWGPVSIYLFMQANIANDSSGMFMAVGFLVYCIIFVSSIDNILRPMFVSDQIKIHPLFVLLGMLGGVAFFQMAGIIIGPLVVGIFITLVEMIHTIKADIK